MKITDVIKKLEAIRKAYGENMEVFIAEEDYSEWGDGESEICLSESNLTDSHFKIEPVTLLGEDYFERRKSGQKRLSGTKIQGHKIILK